MGGRTRPKLLAANERQILLGLKSTTQTGTGRVLAKTNTAAKAGRADVSVLVCVREHQ